MAHDGVRMKGFLRGQIIDKKTGRIKGDTGWLQNSATATGLTNLAKLICGTTTNMPVASAQIGTSFNSASTVLGGSANSLAAAGTSTSGTCTATFTASFDGSNGSLNLGAAGLVAANSALVAGQTFTSSELATNQSFSLTYQLRFATA